MKEYIFSNGMKLIYKKANSNLTSICIAIDAGAVRDGKRLGVAHATEHMVYKGTSKRSEAKINEDLSNIFGFQNAMTNYPYVIYYGTLLSDDFENGIEIFSDIIINPIFTEKGFKEEINVIQEELKEWDEELEQYCEDKLFINVFNNSRLKHPIIGTESSLKELTIKDIKDFYSEYYCSNNTAITVITSLDFEKVKNIIDKYFKNFKCKNINKSVDIKESPKTGIVTDYRDNINTSKIQIISPINFLTYNELKAFTIFNSFFGEGVNSILFDLLRTKNALVYDVITQISKEKHIQLYKITFSLSKENISKAINLINMSIDDLDKYKEILTKEKVNLLIKSIKLKKLFKEEQSIQLAKELSTYQIMFNDYNLYENFTDNMESLTADYIIETGKKVLENLSIQIITCR